MPSRCCEFVDSRLRRSPPDRASAVPYGVAAYSSVGTSGHIFYTAKVLPIGKVNLPEFLGLIRHTEIPIGIDEVGLGPTYKAIVK
jgi:hypothetical protein